MMDYTLGKGKYENWIVSETKFSPDTLGKCESIMYLGNGYMGLRSATEEPYLKEVRNLFVNGTFNKFGEGEVTELPNLADVTRIDIRIDGERFSLELGKTENYVRQLNLKNAELVRQFDWTSPKGKILRFRFRRFVSLENLHLIGMKMEIESVNKPVSISFDSGIDGRMTNSGSQHFLEGEKRIFDKQFLQLLQHTTESNVDVVINSAHQVTVNGKEIKNQRMHIDRRKIWLTFEAELNPGDKLEMEKITNVYTSIDRPFSEEGISFQQLRDVALQDLRDSLQIGYDGLFKKHVQTWEERVWNHYNLHIQSKDGFDLLSLRFAIYHLTAMAPAHDERMGIGAKALSGEGYKGHSFWDTEIFILPFFTYTNPKVARSLLTYRYLGLEGARKKAKENNYEGAMYPWEAAWPSDGEVTPVWGAVDIVTGKQTKIWSGFIEQHITADIAFAVYQYYQITGDQDFMNRYGYEMIFDTAKFWASRLEWDETHGRYHINDVIGPDEYKEHVNNNAFTNYMAHFNLQLAIKYYEKLQRENQSLLKQLNEKLHLEKAYPLWLERSEKLYLPQPNADLVIPQDDTYLQLKEIDLTKYKQSKKVGTLFLDYNLEQVNQMQVTKQADVLVMFYLLNQVEPFFNEEVKRANFHYYEPRTLHDSSLSLSTHAVLANDIGETELAYSLFRRAAEIDLGPFMHSSDHGIHAASIGGIWQAAVCGFAGLRLTGDQLSFHPRLPDHWEEMEFTIYWRGEPVLIKVTKSSLMIRTHNGKDIPLNVRGENMICHGELEIQL
ncbi:glycoside hydrolase family 65 protein [Fervidibacillus halotolerans]|uniref:Glycoside hydrolase family 65 protein n=1 Tax=Fervidibacillus halotolerans TaxID=2980027 RepID=A0A9E8LZ30_9BACI|nr:glycosyl hydrolase family 65 protein [Fervidibacillus halotolerans]WAA12052.1 glycoside hydrolase family 65 protein [Fervidibacillus halotolerans]